MSCSVINLINDNLKTGNFDQNEVYIYSNSKAKNIPYHKRCHQTISTLRLIS